MLKRLLQNSVVLFVLVIILLLIIPLPPALVDVAIVVNMAISMMILVITMTIREPLELSIFPSLLLITTLFRLGINVSTTRNILTRLDYLLNHRAHAVYRYHKGCGACIGSGCPL